MARHSEMTKLPVETHEDRLVMLAREMAFGIRGRWQDTFRRIDGTVEPGPGGEFEWRPNQIQNSFATLLATWLRGESGYARLSYLAVGTGLVGWDAATPAQPYSQTTLETEVFRKAIPQGDIVYLDPATDLPTGGTPSSKVEITSTIAYGETNGNSLREFGLFGGTATITTDSGEMVNWIIHHRIDKDSSLEIQRKVRIEFVTR